jgi:hypothetical protein
VVKLHHDSPIWILDRTNSRGENVIPGSNDISGFLVELDDRLLTIQETKWFYNELRKREFGWDWYLKNNTSWREVKDALEKVSSGQVIDANLQDRIEKIGLISDNQTLTTTGVSLILEQTAAQRKHITFKGRKLE